MQWQHPVERIWQMTPRQCFAWLVLGAERHARERAEMISDLSLAAQGSGDAIKKAMRELTDG